MLWNHVTSLHVDRGVPFSVQQVLLRISVGRISPKHAVYLRLPRRLRLGEIRTTFFHIHFCFKIFFSESFSVYPRSRSVLSESFSVYPRSRSVLVVLKVLTGIAQNQFLLGLCGLIERSDVQALRAAASLVP